MANIDGDKPKELKTEEKITNAMESFEESLKQQQALMVLSMQANTAMAYLQSALSVSGKVAGR